MPARQASRLLVAGILLFSALTGLGAYFWGDLEQYLHSELKQRLSAAFHAAEQPHPQQ